MLNNAQPQSNAVLDVSAMVLSGLCMVHCLALPLLSAFLPLAGALADIEWLHQAFVLTALPITLLAIHRSRHGGEGKRFTVLALLGLALLAVGAFVEPLAAFEVLLTTAGALVLTCAHAWRWLRQAHKNTAFIGDEHA